MTKPDEKIEYGEVLGLTGRYVKKLLLNASPDFFHMTEHLSNTQGKYIRASLLAASASDAGGFVSPDVIKAAAAVELLHAATLVHDDVIDGAELRRSKETIQKKFGRRQAVICGDYLLCLSLSAISGLYPAYGQERYLSLHRVFVKGLEKICHGEFCELINNRNLDMGFYDYLRVISGKTAGLFGIAALCGSVIGGGDDREMRLLSRFGQYQGMLFQIVDDCKDYELTEQAALKSVRTDLCEGVVTLPLILAVKKDPGIKPAAERAMSSGGAAEISALIGRIRGLGALDGTYGIARRYYNKAARIIDKLDNEFKKGRLADILNATVSALPGFYGADS